MLLKLRTSNSPISYLIKTPVTVLSQDLKTWLTLILNKDSYMLVLDHKDVIEFEQGPSLYDFYFVLYNGQTFYIKKDWCEQI